MFTLEQIHEAFDGVKSGSDFPKFIQDLKKIGVQAYENLVSTGVITYFGSDGFRLTSSQKYTPIPIHTQSSAEKLGHALLIYQQGTTDYLTFCQQAAEAGVEKWITNLEAMSVTYVDKADKVIRVEQIPQV